MLLEETETAIALSRLAKSYLLPSHKTNSASEFQFCEGFCLGYGLGFLFAC